MKSLHSHPFPDPAVCKPRHIYEELYECLAEDACCCPYAMAFGHGFYCRHPDCRNFKQETDT